MSPMIAYFFSNCYRFNMYTHIGYIYILTKNQVSVTFFSVGQGHKIRYASHNKKLCSSNVCHWYFEQAKEIYLDPTSKVTEVKLCTFIASDTFCHFLTSDSSNLLCGHLSASKPKIQITVTHFSGVTEPRSFWCMAWSVSIRLPRQLAAQRNFSLHIR